MKKEIVDIPSIKVPDSPFNYVLRVGNFLFLTSQLSVNLQTGKILGGDIIK